MNKSKRPMPAKLRKKMGKEIRLAQNAPALPEEREYANELTAKEMLKKYPKKAAKKQEGLLKAVERVISTKTKKAAKGVSKRTAPGRPPADSSPASPHREGKRWIKNLTKQTLSQRVVEAHRGSRKK